jgi:hypothetical protein
VRHGKLLQAANLAWRHVDKNLVITPTGALNVLG